jgi:hypothetical protein
MFHHVPKIIAFKNQPCVVEYDITNHQPLESVGLILCKTGWVPDSADGTNGMTHPQIIPSLLLVTVWLIGISVVDVRDMKSRNNAKPVARTHHSTINQPSIFI